jgi:hypothetical protein
VKAVLSESQVVLATCHSSGGRQLRNQDFDVVIIDEATQSLEAVSVLLSLHKFSNEVSIIQGVLDSDIQGKEVDFGWRPHATAADDSFPEQQ